MKESVIVVDPEIQSGAPVFAGTRVPIKNLFDYLKAGDSLSEFLAEFPIRHKRDGSRRAGRSPVCPVRRRACCVTSRYQGRFEPGSLAMTCDRRQLGDLIVEADTEIQQAWELEAARRDAEIEEGKATPVSGPELLHRLRASFGDAFLSSRSPERRPTALSRVLSSPRNGSLPMNDQPEHDASSTADREFVHSRLIDAPPEGVFRAFSEPAHLARWWGPDGFSSTIHEFELRAGGHWRFVMHGPDGKDYPNESVFREVIAPERIVFEHLSDHHFEMTITFTAQGAKTLVGWRQVFDTAASANASRRS